MDQALSPGAVITVWSWSLMACVLCLYHLMVQKTLDEELEYHSPSSEGPSFRLNMVGFFSLTSEVAELFSLKFSKCSSSGRHLVLEISSQTDKIC